jgi:hypothetical protein
MGTRINLEPSRISLRGVCVCGGVGVGCVEGTGMIIGNATIPVFEISIQDPRIRGYTLLTFFSSNQIEVVLCVLNLFHAPCTLDKVTIKNYDKKPAKGNFRRAN